MESHNEPKFRQALIAVAIGAGISLLINVPRPFAEYSLLTDGYTQFVVGTFLMNLVNFLVVLALVAIGPLALIGLFVRPARKTSVAVLLGSGAFVLMLAGSIAVEKEVRATVLDEVVDRGAKLVQAIETYQHDTGEPPETLSALVPTYLEQVPPTGLEHVPTFEYQLRSDGEWWVFIPMNFALFYYSPSEQYPDHAHRIHDWVYELY